MVHRCRSELGNDDFDSSHTGTPTFWRDLGGSVLNASYDTKELKTLCTRIEEAQAEIGPQPAAELYELLAEAESFHTADELIEFRDGKTLVGDSLSFSFGAHYRAAFKAIGEDHPLKLALLAGR